MKPGDIVKGFHYSAGWIQGKLVDLPKNAHNQMVFVELTPGKDRYHDGDMILMEFSGLELVKEA